MRNKIKFTKKKSSKQQQQQQRNGIESISYIKMDLKKKRTNLCTEKNEIFLW